MRAVVNFVIDNVFCCSSLWFRLFFAGRASYGANYLCFWYGIFVFVFFLLTLPGTALIALCSCSFACVD